MAKATLITIIYWCAASAAAGISIATYAHNNFVTKYDQETVIRRLDRIEEKIDRLIEGKRYSK